MARKDVTNGYISEDMVDANDNFIELYTTKTEVETARGTDPDLNTRLDTFRDDITLLGDAELPGQTGSSGKFLTTDGTAASWDLPLPVQTSNAGKFLTTDGTTASWDSTAGGHESSTGAVDVTLTSTSKQVQKITITAADKYVNLPDATGLYKGADTYVIVNYGDYRFGLKDNAGTFICSIAPHSQGRLSLLDNSTAAGTWKASAPADLIMNTLKTECYVAESNYIASCKLSATELFVAWLGLAGDGFCAVLTFGGTITVSNILEFDTDLASYISCDAISPTVAAVAYRGTSNHGKIAAITWDEVDTLVVTDTYTFLAATITYTNVHVVTSGLVFVAYQNASDITCVQMLSWDGSVFGSDTAENTLGGTVRWYPKTAKISGDATDAKFVLVNSGTTTTGGVNSAIVTWNSSTGFSIGSAATTAVILNSTGHHMPVAIDSDYFLVVGQYYNSGAVERSLGMTLCSVSGTTITNRRYLFTEAHSLTHAPIGGFLFDSETVFLFTNEKSYENYLYKIKVVGAADTKDCVLSVENKVPLGYNSQPVSHYGDAALLSGNNAAIVYRNVLASNYLYAEKVEIA